MTTILTGWQVKMARRRKVRGKEERGGGRKSELLAKGEGFDKSEWIRREARK